MQEEEKQQYKRNEIKTIRKLRYLLNENLSIRKFSGRESQEGKTYERH